jgi:hypothetical protein
MSRRKNKTQEAISAFKTEDQERKFWASHDSTECVDWSNTIQPTLPNLKRSTTSAANR